MDFLLNEPQKTLKQKVIRLCEEKLQLLEEKVGETNVMSREIAAALAGAGLFKLLVTEEYGNSIKMPSLVSVCIVREQLARCSLNAELIFVMQGLGSYPIMIAGNKEQKEKYCPLIATGKKIFTFALTEPSAGSDVASIQTSAVLAGEDFIVNGRKMFISLAPDADIYTVMVKTDRERGAKGISALIVEKGYPGFDPGRRLDLVAAHPIGAPVFENCRVPKTNLIGELNEGFKIALQNLDFFRSTVAAGAVGMAQAAFEEALKYARQRVQFGKKIAEFQAIQFKLADMATELAAARGLIYQAAYLFDRDAEKITMESSMAKLYATEAAQRIIDQAVQIHGGYGVVKGYLVEKLYRAIRSMRLYEGTSEIQHLVIAHMLLKE